MNSAHAAAATVELPTLLHEIHDLGHGGRTRSSSRPRTRKVGDDASTKPRRMSQRLADPGADIELTPTASVRSREAGERDPLLLRDKLKSDAELDSLRQ